MEVFMNTKVAGRKRTRLARAVTCGVSVLIAAAIGLGQAAGQTESASPQTADELIGGLYGLVSATAGKMPDWQKVRACFLDEAVIILRTSRTATTTFSLDGFIKDFVDFYERPFKIGEKSLVPKDSGFGERVVRMKTWEYGDMAHALVLYEAQITGSGRAPQQGIDSWLLARRNGRWFIAAITNEIVTPGRPLPPELQEEHQAPATAPPGRRMEGTR
jgi:hypothetical protein